MAEKNKKMKKSSFGLLEVSILVLTTCFLSLGFGYFLGHKTVKETKDDSYIEKFKENYQYIIKNYYKDVDKNALIDGAVQGMIESLGDDFSTYIDQSTSNTFDITLDGAYEGLGISIVGDTDGNISIVHVYEDSPAIEVGLESGDIIKSINGESTEGWATTQVTEYIKKNKTGKFKIVVLRDGKEVTVDIEKGDITLRSVSSRMIEENGKKIGYISISIFALNTNSQFASALEKLEKQGMDSLIIDVRNNGGGHLVSAAQVTSELLDKKKVMYQTEVKGETTKVYADGNLTKKYPIVFLTNEGTASGSEVLVAAVTENTSAIAVGTKTYGKGTVQELVGLGTGNQYKVTVKKWLTPKGTWVEGNGIQPDLEVNITDAYAQNPTTENDNQLQAAIDYIKNK